MPGPDIKRTPGTGKVRRMDGPVGTVRMGGGDAMMWEVALGVAVAVPAVLAATVARRLLVPAMLAWAALPLAVYAGIIGWEVLARPPARNALGTALYGLALISPVLAPPWLASCLAGFGVGLLLRRLRCPVPTACVPAACVPTAGLPCGSPGLSIPDDAAVRPADSPYRRISPDRTLRVELAAAEWSDGHWVNSPRVVEGGSGRVLLDLWNTDWDAAVSFPRARCIRLSLRQYCGSGGVVAEIDLARDAYRLLSGGEAAWTGPLASMPAALDAWSRRPAARPAPGGSAWGRPRSPVAAWRTAAVLALGAFLAIAGAAYVSLQAGMAAGGWPPVPQRTASIPSFD